ncbi:hypothetical protein [Enterococcus mediterraneensis]|uniref:hypothetical protein n=1 Tax=Enterococcus mediterraneensis TaxID=2364791 RepID=UPI000F071A2E|nr:hypothetical protein [Enterococcus mediterraneensis]
MRKAGADEAKEIFNTFVEPYIIPAQSDKEICEEFFRWKKRWGNCVSVERYAKAKKLDLYRMTQIINNNRKRAE